LASATVSFLAAGLAAGAFLAAVPVGAAVFLAAAAGAALAAEAFLAAAPVGEAVFFAEAAGAAFLAAEAGVAFLVPDAPAEPAVRLAVAAVAGFFAAGAAFFVGVVAFFTAGVAFFVRAGRFDATVEGVALFEDPLAAVDVLAVAERDAGAFFAGVPLLGGVIVSSFRPPLWPVPGRRPRQGSG
jgi:hypothetical protein